jgi:signal transduction histidine kinase
VKNKPLSEVLQPHEADVTAALSQATRLMEELILAVYVNPSTVGSEQVTKAADALGKTVSLLREWASTLPPKVVDADLRLPAALEPPPRFSNSGP